MMQSSIPTDILQHFLFLLPVQDLFRSQQVCKQWRQETQNAPATLWAEYYCRFYFCSSNATLEDDKNRVLKARTKYGMDEEGNTMYAFCTEERASLKQRCSAFNMEEDLIFWRGLTLNRAKEYYTHTAQLPVATLSRLTQQADIKFDRKSLLLNDNQELGSEGDLGLVGRDEKRYLRMQRISSLIPPFLKHHRASVALLDSAVRYHSHNNVSNTFYDASFVMYGATGARIFIYVEFQERYVRSLMHYDDYDSHCSVRVNGRVLLSYDSDYCPSEKVIERGKNTFLSFVNLLYGEEKGKTLIDYDQTKQELLNFLKVCDGFSGYGVGGGSGCFLYRKNPVPSLEALQGEPDKSSKKDGNYHHLIEPDDEKILIEPDDELTYEAERLMFEVQSKRKREDDEDEDSEESATKKRRTESAADDEDQ